MFTINGKATASQLLFPVSLVAFVVFILLAFEMSQFLRDRSALHDVLAQQQKPMEEAQRVQAQLNALAVGTLKLSQKGDKGAEAIIARMKQMGIMVGGQQQQGAAPAAPDAAAAPAPDAAMQAPVPAAPAK